MNVTVTRVHIPAMSTLGYGYGTNERGESVEFVGDHRPMRDIGEALAEGGAPVAMDVELYQVVKVTKPTLLGAAKAVLASFPERDELDLAQRMSLRSLEHAVTEHRSQANRRVRKMRNRRRKVDDSG